MLTGRQVADPSGCWNRKGFGMSVDGIFLTSGTDLVVLRPQTYEKEDVLQKALAEYPDVIAGPTTSGATAGKLLLVRREMGVPSTEGGGSVWSLDHLFLDADGVPVIVEVKRSTDTRIRREVVGQMLDYAANGVKYWPVATLRAALEQAAEEDGKTGDELVAALRADLDPEEFWKTVEANLAAGRIRMVFVADALPAELVRIIEFLNEQMNPAEVLGVELRRYVGGVNVAYVPTVVGRTAAAVAGKQVQQGQGWDEESFLDAARACRPDQEVVLMQKLIAHVHARNGTLSWGKHITPGVSGRYSVASAPTPVWIMRVISDTHAPSARFELTAKWIAPRLAASGQGFGRLEAAAHALLKIPNTADKIDVKKASDHDWKTDFKVAFNDIAEGDGHIQDVISAIDAIVDPGQIP
jgi:hypothetical protein